MELISARFSDIRRNRLLTSDYNFVLMHVSKRFQETFKVPLQKSTLRNFAIHCCKHGHLRLLEWLVEMKYLRQSTPDWGEYILNVAKTDPSGWINNFIKKRHPSDCDFYINAAKSGQIATLEWLKRNKYTLIGDKCLKENNKWYVMLNTSEWKIIKEIVEEMRRKEWQLYARMCFVSNEDLATLEWLKTIDNFSDKDHLLMFVIGEGSIACLKLLFQYELELYRSHFTSTRLCDWAATRGKFEMLKCLRGYGCQWDSNTCMCSAMKENVDIVKWSILNGCPHDSSGIVTAWIKTQNVETVGWLLERGCFLDRKILSRKCYSGRPVDYWTVEMIQLLLRHGCELHRNLCDNVRQSGNLKLLAWLIDNGCPYDNEDYVKYRFFKSGNFQQ